jgi:hypothetical protein
MLTEEQRQQLDDRVAWIRWWRTPYGIDPGDCPVGREQTLTDDGILAVAAHLAALEEENGRLRAALVEIEWCPERTAAGTINLFCPVCHSSRTQVHNYRDGDGWRQVRGHREKCKLGAALARLDAPVNCKGKLDSCPQEEASDAR